MKRSLIILLLIWGVAEAQPVPGYTYINGRYNYFGIATNDLLAPAGGTVARGAGSWNRSGALMYDSTGTDTGLYVYHRPYWVKVGGGISSISGTPKAIAYYTPTTGVLNAGSGALEFRPASDADANTMGMVRIWYRDAVSLGPEGLLHASGNDIGNMWIRIQNAYSGGSTNNAISYQLIDSASGKVAQIYFGNPNNSFTLGGVMLHSNGAFVKLHSESGPVDLAAGSLGAPGTNTVLRVTTAARVGVGTLTPGQKLEVTGSFSNSDSVIHSSIARVADTTGFDMAVLDRSTGNMKKIYSGLIGGGGTNIYNTDGTVTGDRLVTHSGNTLAFSAANTYFEINDVSATFNFVAASVFQVAAPDVKLIIAPTLQTDTTTHKYLGRAVTGGEIVLLPAPAGGSGVTSVDLAYGITGSSDPITTTGTVILDTTIAVNKAGEQTILGHKTMTGTFTVSSPSGAFRRNFSIDNAGTQIEDQNVDYLWRRGGSNAMTLSVNQLTLPAGVSLNVDGSSLVVNQSTNLIGLGTASPTARLEIIAGSATANTAPVELNSGPLETAIRSGLIEFNGSHYVSTITLNRVGIGGAIADFTADAANGTTVETDLYTYTTKASTLDTIGAKITAEYAVLLTDATADKVIKIYFAGIEIFTSGTLTAAVGTYKYDVTIIRTGASTARAIVTAVRQSTFGSADQGAETDLTGLTFSGTNIIKITGTASGASGGSSDIVAKMGAVYFWPAAKN